MIQSPLGSQDLPLPIWCEGSDLEDIQIQCACYSSLAVLARIPDFEMIVYTSVVVPLKLFFVVRRYRERQDRPSLCSLEDWFEQIGNGDHREILRSSVSRNYRHGPTQDKMVRWQTPELFPSLRTSDIALVRIATTDTFPLHRFVVWTFSLLLSAVPETSGKYKDD